MERYDWVVRSGFEGGLLLCESNCIVSGVVIGSIEWVCLINPREEA